MIKMYNAEVLSKFPVVQHFPFGSLFSWDQDPDATPTSLSVHTVSQPASSHVNTGAPTARPLPQEGTKAPWAKAAPAAAMDVTVAPWAQSQARPATGMPPTRAPRANQSTSSTPSGSAMGVFDGPTKVPWAKKDNPR